MVPQVAHTPAGANELEIFRRQQLKNTGIAWAVPGAALLLTLLLDALGARGATSLAAIAMMLSGAAAPGLSFVFWMRRRKARQLVEGMPQLPSARLQLRSGPRQEVQGAHHLVGRRDAAPGEGEGPGQGGP